MAKMLCEICGSSNFIKENNYFVCQKCGMKYTVDQAKSLYHDKKNRDNDNHLMSNKDEGTENRIKLADDDIAFAKTSHIGGYNGILVPILGRANKKK